MADEDFIDAQAPSYIQFSADVRLELRAGGQIVDLASIGPDAVVARLPAELERGPAEIVMTVDGDPVTWQVMLPNGAVPYDKTIETRPRHPAGQFSS